jgi:predicted nucleic acid-binding protein
MTMTERIALDTNILLFLHDTNQQSVKKNIAEELVSSNPIISTQVISEYLNVCHKRFKLTKSDAMDALMKWLPFSEVANIAISTYTNAIGLIKKYDFQLFDAIIIAAAIDANCSKLFTEDMHHGLLVEKRLQIINPFYSGD